LPAGLYRVRVSPRDSANFNYYDIRLIVNPAISDCDPGELEFLDCGMCGYQARECDDTGSWGAYDECSDEGECSPGEEIVEICGNCGTTVTTCDDFCTLVPGECQDEGECAAGTTEQEACEGGDMRSRACDEACVWGEFTECGAAVCQDGDEELCYDGPVETRGVGVCRIGRRECLEEQWGGCRNQVLPSLEVCGDELDNDCDGGTDSDDSDGCQAGQGELGEACTSEEPCSAGLDTQGAPELAQFVEGYCSDLLCTQSSECGGGGVCATIFGESLCLLGCNDSNDCRDGYECLQIGGVQGCAPPCGDHDDCTDPELSLCNFSTGVCEAAPTGEDTEPADEAEDVGGEDTGVGADTGEDDAATESDGEDAGADTGNRGAVPDDGCGCGVAGRPRSAWWLVVAALTLWAIRRRRVPRSGRPGGR
jgi:MYXO-CTERM domain-containing protein